MGQYNEEIHENAGRTRHGSPLFYSILEDMATLHDRKSHDYADNSNPYGNYYYAGQFASLFAYSNEDAGFASRLGEKLYRLANLEKSQKIPLNEAIIDTELDICVIVTLWMSSRRDRRKSEKEAIEKVKHQMNEGTWGGIIDDKDKR